MNILSEITITLPGWVEWCLNGPFWLGFIVGVICVVLFVCFALTQTPPWR